MDTARLDIVHSRLWGRAESLRTTLCALITAAAPVLSGWLSAQFSHDALGFAAAPGSGDGLRTVFLLALLAPITAALILVPVRRHYSTDVATARAPEHDTSTGTDAQPDGRKVGRVHH